MKKDIFLFKILLIILTMLELGSIFALFYDDVLLYRINQEHHLNTLIMIYSFSLTGVFIWYNWKKLPISNKKKKDKTWMLALLGLIGIGIIAMWLWLPNTKEVNSYLKEPNLNNS